MPIWVALVMSLAKNADGVKTIVNNVLPSETDLVHFAGVVSVGLLLAGFMFDFASMLLPGIHTHTHADERLASGVPVTSYTTVISSVGRNSAGVMVGSIDSFDHTTTTVNVNMSAK